MTEQELIHLLSNREQFSKRINTAQRIYKKSILAFGTVGVIMLFNLIGTLNTMSENAIASDYFLDLFFLIDFQNDPLFSTLLVIAGIVFLFGVISLIFSKLNSPKSFNEIYESFLAKPDVKIYNVLTFQKQKLVIIEQDTEKQRELENALHALDQSSNKLKSMIYQFITGKVDEQKVIKALHKHLNVDGVQFNITDVIKATLTKPCTVAFVTINNDRSKINTKVEVDAIANISLVPSY